MFFFKKYKHVLKISKPKATFFIIFDPELIKISSLWKSKTTKIEKLLELWCTFQKGWTDTLCMNTFFFFRFSEINWHRCIINFISMTLCCEMLPYTNRRWTLFFNVKYNETMLQSALIHLHGAPCVEVVIFEVTLWNAPYKSVLYLLLVFINEILLINEQIRTHFLL